MKYTFEVSVAGCNTECAHCYISGGPAPAVRFDGYKRAITALNGILKRIDGEIYVTLGDEIFNHPQIAEMVSFTHGLMPSYYSYNDFLVPTTGIALLKRKDRRAVLEALRGAGCAGFMLTLHGNKAHQNAITQNNAAYDALKEAAGWLYGEGYKLRFNLMLSKFLVSDWEAVCGFLAPFPEADRVLTIPLYLPTDRLRGFQRYRAEYGDCMELRGRLAEAKIEEERFFGRVHDNCEQNIHRRLEKNESIDYAEEEGRTPQWSFFNVNREFDLFYGNVGLHTKRLGNLMEDSQETLAERIRALPANYDWSAYYQLSNLPPISSVIRGVQPLNTNFVYPGLADCVYSWFDRIGVQPILL